MRPPFLIVSLSMFPAAASLKDHDGRLVFSVLSPWQDLGSPVLVQGERRLHAWSEDYDAAEMFHGKQKGADGDPVGH
jgi:hypothetical protein